MPKFLTLPTTGSIFDQRIIQALVFLAVLQTSQSGFAQLQTSSQAAQASALGVSERIYLVQAGDSLQSIAQQNFKFGGSWQALRDLNRIALGSQNLIVPGQRLRVLAAWVEPAPVLQTVARLQSRGQDLILQLPQGARDSSGGTLMQGSLLRTGAQPARISLEDGSMVQLAPRTELFLESMKKDSASGQFQNVLRLVTGSVQTVVTKLTGSNPDRLRIVTSTATIGVRGTVFRASILPDASVSSEVLEGAAQLEAQSNAVALPKGFGSKASIGQRPIDAVPLLPASTGFTRLPLLESRPLSPMTSARFEWQAVSQAIRYEISVAQDENFANLIETISTTNAMANFEQVPRGYIFVRVRAYDHHGLGGYDLVQAVRM